MRWALVSMPPGNKKQLLQDVRGNLGLASQVPQGFFFVVFFHHKCLFKNPSVLYCIVFLSGTVLVLGFNHLLQQKLQSLHN